MSIWGSIEVIDTDVGASLWAQAWGDTFVEAALSHGALDWSWQHHTWGVVFQIEFADEAAWEAFRELAAIRAALEAAPDPVNGVIVYRGRGGSCGNGKPRKPRPMAGSGSAALPLPWAFEAEASALLAAVGTPRRALVLA
ncbi:MAG: hypothetical protein ACRDYC_00230 [Acidimicrobiales bacterium]